ncbi:hypothetical protein DEI92_15775 [Curtobacterium sp. MCBD17_034]|uniref:DUF6197 family protein n=1 Tax=unclassified Curtobacterium TaxID=257496 RepID=UPI000DA87096|nr:MULTISPECIES: hypothetical protein [unclassified Curtobacterium]PZF55488.1 hypothetical protein DEI92_15775 [Curtobacterium sp. MCBD17_034]PZM34743.1 hypothetical protein DEI90_04630 [Curtobacterium sp. MCBD17_031]
MTLEFRVQHDVDSDASPVRETTTPRRSGLFGWVDRHHERRAAARGRRVAAQLAELASLQHLLSDARDVVDHGWIQHAWFAYLDDRGRTRKASSAAALDVAGRPLVGACLVGAVVYAAGGPHAVHSQPVQRALDLVWHALAVEEGAPVMWCPAPDVRMGRVRDLTSWNDAPSRTATDVASLLLTAERVAVHESDRIVARAAAREAVPA